MIFKPELCAKVLDGSKTVTRRPLNGPCLYQVGKDYAVQPGRGKHAVGRILIEDIDYQALGHICTLGDKEARREGFEHVGEFMAYWRGLYHGQFFRGQLVSRIQFRLLDVSREDARHADPDALAAR